MKENEACMHACGNTLDWFMCSSAWVVIQEWDVSASAEFGAVLSIGSTAN